MSSSELEQVCRYFISKDIKMSPSNEWLKACITWFKSEKDSCTIHDIQEYAYSQLLLADLNSVAQECLPNIVSEAHTTTLQGKYFLQVNYFMDVGQPAYVQHQKLLKQSLINLQVTEEKEEKWEPAPNRMLKMEMTDGIHVVYGMEYTPIKKLNITMFPGIKVIVKGPVECRSGVIMLQEKNIDVCGGEVDSLYKVNHFHRIIARMLKLDENSIPICDDNDDYDSAIIIEHPADQGMSEQNFPSKLVTGTLPSTTATSSEIASKIRDNNSGMNDDFFADSDIFVNLPVEDIVETNTSNKKRLIEVDAEVVAFRSKLLIKDDNWYIIVRIKSSEGSMKACFDPDLLDRLIGFSPTELTSKHSEIAVNPAIREKLSKLLQRGQQTIKDLKCHMTLVQESDSELPVIIRISDDNAFYDSTLS
ncbi:uncharacterized protein LOC142327672 [Lycorma delicatula]|uniref:uncharacterized protein LOC142327672 n=1 Tax=Lycorma delicatula TaxID=130591 RepID=UPI003F50E11B